MITQNQNQNSDSEKKENDTFFYYDPSEKVDEQVEPQKDVFLEGEINNFQEENICLFDKTDFLHQDKKENQESENNLTEIKENETLTDRGYQEIKQILESKKQVFFNQETSSQETNPSDSLETFSLPLSKAILAKKLLQNIQENNDKLLQIFSSLDENKKISFSQETNLEEVSDQGDVIEGVFDGENMIGPDGKKYSVPTNYASKSKLVEGDILKLTITSQGGFKYKQIYPIQRTRVVGELKKSEEGEYYVVNEEKNWKVLSASVSYFKGNPGDEAVILIPAEGESRWGAIENIIKV